MILAGALLALSTGCAARLNRYEFIQPKMGTGFRVVLYAPDERTAQRAQAAAYARIDQLNAALSDYDPQSELSRLSRRTDAGAMPEPVPVGDDLYRVLARSLEAARVSDGAFDVTLGPCVRLWRRSRDMGQLPTPERLAEARQSVGYRFVKLFPATRGVQLLAPKMRLDLGGIAKGYAAREALAAMRKLGVARALVGAAGDVAAGDPPPGQAQWRVAVRSLDAPGAADAPAPAGGSPPAAGVYVKRVRSAVSTSGDTERFTMIDGRRYSHILDPRTGLGLTRRVGVTVLAPDAATTDWLSTAVSVMGPEQGLALVERLPGAAARVVTRDADGRTQVFESRRFGHFVDEPAALNRAEDR